MENPKEVSSTLKFLAGQNRRGFLCALLCGLLAAIIHIPAFYAGFVWDDAIVAQYQTPYLKDFSNAVSPPKDLVSWSPDYFRPLVTASYILDERVNNSLYGNPGFNKAQRLGPKRAKIPHAESVLLHGVASALVALLAGAMLEKNPKKHVAMLVAGVAFAVFPPACEVADVISGRSDSLAAVFLLSSVILGLNARKHLSFAALSALSFFLALCSKETALSGFLLLPLAFYLCGGLPLLKSRAAKLALGGCLAAGAVYFLLRLNSLGGIKSSATSLAFSAKALFGALGFYLGKAVFPWPTSPFVPVTPGAALGLALGALSLPLLYLAVKSHRRGEGVSLFAWAWFFCTLAPALAVSLGTFSATPVAQRHLYLPYAGAALTVGTLAARLWEHKFRNAAFGGLALLFSAHAITSFTAAREWQTEEKLWTGVLTNPVAANHPLPWNNLGNAQLDANKFDEAIRSFNGALSVTTPLAPEDRALALSGIAGVYFQRGNTAFRQGNYAAAQGYYVEAQKFFDRTNQTGFPSWTFLIDAAQVKLQMALCQKALNGAWDVKLLSFAEWDLRQALNLSPQNPEVLQLLGRIRGLMGGR